MEINKTDSASVVLKLYELRRDAEMRDAREWYLTHFQPQSAQEIVNLLLESFEGSRQYRMVTSYWDMAASLVLNGAIDRDVFLGANTEHIAVYARLHPYLAEVQKVYRETYLKHLQTLVLSLPDAEKLVAGRIALLDSWNKGVRKSGNVGFR
ncbi:MAG: hypothetical protein EAZ92_14440 [Candidatus Kapaibacterium sp.]|nr:MAG: hypothetical protein EAZ92_14440 [Candidatus Kapabacteria bacterium]